MRYLFVLFIIVTNINVATSADGKNYFYKSSILSQLPVHSTTSDQNQWLTSFGYNWNISPRLGFDVGYVDLVNDLGESSESHTDFNYQSVFGAALLQQSFGRFGTIYAKGGLNWSNDTSTGKSTAAKFLDASFNDIAPFLSIGANIPAPLQKNIELNVELSYQNLQLEEPDAMLLMGAKYRF